MKNIFSKTLKEIKDSRRKGKKSILQEYYGKFLIYKWDINGKSYIGLTTNLKVRIKNYLSNIYSNHYFKNKNVNEEIYVVGLAKGRDEALNLVRDIIDEVYNATGGFDIREYLGFGNK